MLVRNRLILITHYSGNKTGYWEYSFHTVRTEKGFERRVFVPADGSLSKAKEGDRFYLLLINGKAVQVFPEDRYFPDRDLRDHISENPELVGSGIYSEEERFTALMSREIWSDAKYIWLNNHKKIPMEGKEEPYMSTEEILEMRESLRQAVEADLNGQTPTLPEHVLCD